MLQVRNYRVSYRLRAWSLLDMTVALRDLETTFSANQISVSNLLYSKVSLISHHQMETRKYGKIGPY